MPTYMYECAACGHEFERFQSIASRPLRKCPRCGKPQIKRLIGAGAGIIFRGSGFYETDYRSDSYKKAAEKEKGSPDKAATTKVEAKEAKPETTTPAKKESA